MFSNPPTLPIFARAFGGGVQPGVARGAHAAACRGRLWQACLLGAVIALSLTAGAKAQPGGQYFNLSSANYFENFSNISSWNNFFINTPTNQNVWKAAATNDGITFGGSSAWVVGGSGGIEKGNQALIIFNNSGNSSDAAAVNLCMNFSNRVAGTLSFRWAKLTNGVNQLGNSSDLRIRFSTNGGTNWSNLAEGGTNALPLRINNNGMPQSNTLTVALPSTINNRTNVEFQFYVWHNGQNIGGDRPKFVLDDVAVTSTPFGPPSVEVGSRTNFTSNGVTFVSNVVTSENGTPITERGVVWSYGMFNPTTNDTKVVVPGTDLNPYSVTLTNLTNSIFVRAYAINSSGVGYSTNVQQYRPPPFFPNPTLAGRNATTNSFELTWTSANNHESYSLRVDDDPAFLSPISVPGIFNTATNTTVNTGLLPGTLYSVRLEASNLFGTATNSTTQWTVPLAPTNLGGQSLATTEFTARWAVTTGATNGYRLDVDDASDFSSPVSGFNNLTVNSTNQLVSGLTAGTQYFFRVRAVNPGGTSANSTNFSQWTLPDAPFNLAAASITAGGFSASWEQPVSATGYRLDVDDSADFSSPLSGFNNLTVSGTTQSVTGLAAGTEYYFRVRAVNSGGTGASSTNFSQWTLPAAPANLAASSISTNGFTVTWSATLSATSYRLDVDDSSDFSSPESGYNDLTVSGTSQAITGLAADTTYYVRVRAANPAGTGASSTLSEDTAPGPGSPPRGSLTLTGTLGSFSTVFGTASAVQSFTVAGASLNTNTAVSVKPPAGYEVSLSANFSTEIGTIDLPLSLGTGTTANASVFIRLADTNAVGSLYTGDVVVEGGGAKQRVLTILSGTVLPDLPGAPTLGTITAGPNQLSVEFTPPTYDGGSAITNYEYSIDGGVTYTALFPAQTSGPLVIPRLNEGVAYTVRIRAVNEAGNGPASDPGSGTPTAPPGGSQVLGGTNVTFGSGPNTFEMEFVPVGNPGNAANMVVVNTMVGFDPMTGPIFATTTNFLGAVPYSFRMAKFEVTRGMVSAVNSAGMMNLALRPSPPGGTGTNQPAMGISWNMMARFVNWLNTSQGHSPAYKFSRAADPMNGNDDDIQLWSPGDEGYNPANPFRNAKAVYALPSEDEWYKAAFHGGTNKYWLYPTAQDSAPTRVASGTNGAVYSDPMDSRTNPAAVNLAGGPSFYGTVGQGGNVAEMTESSLSRTNNSATNGRIQYGGDWTSFSATLANSFRSGFAVPPTNSANYNNVGFRVVQILPVASAPTIVSITPGDRQLSVAFTPPTSDGGSAIANYQYSIDGGTNYVSFSPAQTNSPLVITGLTNGTTYTVRIKAVNNGGPGLESNSDTGTPIASPTLALFAGLPPTTPAPVTLTHTNSFTMTTNSSQLTFPKFDPASGSLTGVRLSMQGTVTNQFYTPPAPPYPPQPEVIARYTSQDSMGGPETVSGFSAVLSGQFPALASGTFTSSKDLSSAMTPSLPISNPVNNSNIWFRVSSAQALAQFSQTNVMTQVGTEAAKDYFTGASGSVSLNLSQSGNFSRSGMWAPLTGSFLNSTGTVTLSYTYTPPAVTGASSLTNFTTTFGTPSPAQTFTVNGSNLNGSEVTLQPPAGYEISLDENFATVGTSSSPLSLGTPATISNTPVYVRLAESAAGGSSYRGNISLSGGGAPMRSLAIVSGTVTKVPQAAVVTGSVTVGSVNVGGTSAAVGAGGSGTGVYQYRIKDNVTGVVTLASNGAITAVGAGTAEIEVRRLGDQNYEDSGWVSAGTVTVTASVASPSLTLSALSGTGSFTTIFGTPSTAQSFTVSGSNLDGTAVLVTPPAGYEVSLTSDFASVGTSGSPLSLGTAASISGTQVYVRLASGNAVGSTYTGDIEVSGGGATTQTVAITSGTVTAVPPGAPTLGVITAGDGQLSVAFTPPTNTGGAPITNYEYSTDGVNFTAFSPADTTSPLVITGLPNGTTYTVVIRAVNSAGSGPASNSGSGTPVAPTGGDTPTFTGANFTFGSGANTFTMDFMAVGEPGNPDDVVERITRDFANGGNATNTVSVGAVDYRYRMAKFEVSRGQVTAANAAGGLSLTLPSSAPGGTGSNQPATISWNMMARFVNWMNTIRGYPPAYKFSVQPGQPGYNANANIEMWTTNDSGYDPANPFRNTNACFVLPNDDEWHKAAYHGGGTKYWIYPTAEDLEPTAVRSGTNGAVFTQRRGLDPGQHIVPTNPAAVHLAGGPSFYGTVGQGGNVYELLETSIRISAPLNSVSYVNDSPTNDRGVRGANWTANHFTLVNSQSLMPAPPTMSDPTLGFRVAQARLTPSAPTITTITPGTNQYSVAFTPPISDGGDAITNYEYSTDGGLTFTAVSPTSTNSPLVISNLVGGESYPVVIRAVNTWGSGLPSEPVTGGLVIAAPSATPSLTLGALSGTGSFTASFGTNSVAQSFTVSGSNLDGTAVLVAPPAGYEVSLDENFGTVGTSGSPLDLGDAATLGSTTVYVRLASGNAVGSTYTGDITVSGGGATTQTVAITSGTVNKADQGSVSGTIVDDTLTIGETTTVSGTGGSGTGVYEYRVKGGGSSVVTVASDGTITAVGTGTAEIEVRRLGGSNYNDSDWGSAGTVTVSAPAASLSVSGTLTGFTTTYGTASAAQSFTVSGSNLNGTAVLVTPPAGYEVSLDPNFGTSSTSLSLGTAASISGTQVYVRLASGSAVGSSYTGNITVSGGGGTTQTVAITSGTVNKAEQENVQGVIDSSSLTMVSNSLVTASGGSGTGIYEYRVKGGGSSVVTVDVDGTITAMGVGEAEIEVRRLGDDQYLDTDWVSAGTVTVSKAEQDPITASVDEPNLVLGQLSSVTYFGGSGSGSFEFRIKDGVSSVVEVGSDGAITTIGVGTVEIEVRRLGDNQYLDTDWVSAGMVTVSDPIVDEPALILGAWSEDGIFTTSGDAASDAQSFTVEGSNLDTNQPVTVTPPEGYEVSLDPDFGTVGTITSPLELDTSTGEINATVYVRLASGNAVGSSYTGNITVSGGGGTTQTVAITSGTVNKADQGSVSGTIVDDTLTIGETTTVSGTGGSGTGVYEYRVKGGGSSVVTVDSNGTITAVGTGTAEIEVRRLGDSDYNDSDWGSAGTVTVSAPGASLSVSGTLTGFTTTYGTASAAQSFTVSGSNLDGTPVLVTPPAGYEVSLDPNFGTSSTSLSLGTAASISGTQVYVRLASGSAVGSSYTGNITVSGGGGTTQTVAITSGTVNKADQGSVSGTIVDNTLTIGETTTVSGTGGSGTGAYEYRVKGGGSSVVTVASDGTITAVGTGSAEIEVRRLGDSNYNDSDWGSAGTVTVSAPAASLSVSGTLSSFTTIFGTPSTAQSFTVSGSNLNTNSAVLVTPPAGYEVSLSEDFTTMVGTSGSPLDLGDAATLGSTTVYVRLASGSAVGNSYTGNITVSGGGGTTQTVAITSGTVNKADQGSVSGTIGDTTLTVGETTTVSGTGGSGTGVYEYRVKGGGSSVVTVASNGTITAVGTGSAEIEVRRLGDGNYNDSAWGSAGFVTVSASSSSVVANNITLARDGRGGSTTSIHVGQILAANSYAPNAPLTVSLPSGATAAGGSVSRDHRWILYTSSVSLPSSSADSFTYTITDGSGASATGTVTLTAGDYSAVAANIVSVVEATAPATGKFVTFAVTPNFSYHVYASSSLGGSAVWSNTQSNGNPHAAGQHGFITIHDAQAGSVRFYKLEVDRP